MYNFLNCVMRFADALRYRSVQTSVVCVSALSLLAGQVSGQQPPQTDKPAEPVISNQKDEIKQMEAYYVEMYSEPLRAKGRFPKLLAIMSLSKILGDKTSSSVFELVTNKDPVVGYLAWEVLHARHTHLKPELQLAWAQAGIERGADGELPGTTLAAPLLAAAAHPPTEFAKYRTKIIDRVLDNYKPTVEQDLPVLDAARVLVRSWRDPAMLTRLKGKLSDDAAGAAAWHILEPLAQSASKGENLDSVGKRRAAVDAWQKSPEGKYDPSGLTPYTTLGKMLPEPKQITDPNADEWRKELEIGKLDVDSIDVVWVIDSTGSMNVPNQIIAKGTSHFAATLGVVTDRVRFGATYYRHEVDPKLLQKCCSDAAAKPFYQTKNHPLTDNIRQIVATLKNEPIPKPDRAAHRNFHPGSAVAGGLYTALSGQQWVAADKGKRVIILVGDARLTPNSETTVQSLVKEATAQKFLIHSLLLGVAIKEWPQYLKESGIEPTALPKVAEDSPKITSVFESLEKAVIYSTVSQNYHSRIDPLMEALKPFIEGVARQ